MLLLLQLCIFVCSIYMIHGNEHRTDRHCDDTDLSPSDVLSTSTVRDYICYTRDRWKNLKQFMHPTQADVGYALVLSKVINNFDTASNAQEFMNPIWSKKWPNLAKEDFNYTLNTIPVIIGPTSKNNSLRFYAVDYHHHLSALDYSEHDKTYVYLNILDDYRTYSYQKFIEQLKQEKNTYLYSQNGSKKAVPTNISFLQLPKTWDFNKKKKLFGDNPWRSLVGYGRKLDYGPDPFPSCNVEEGDAKYCMRLFIKSCSEKDVDIPFFEFIWAYFFVDATYYSTEYWNGSDSRYAFKKAYDKLLDKYYDKNGDWIDGDIKDYKSLISDWDEAASLLLPLSRSDGTKTYKPLDFFDMDQLPGYIQGPQKVDDDPICSDLPKDDDTDTSNMVVLIAVISAIVIVAVIVVLLIVYGVVACYVRIKQSILISSISDQYEQLENT